MTIKPKDFESALTFWASEEKGTEVQFMATVGASQATSEHRSDLPRERLSKPQRHQSGHLHTPPIS